MGLSLNKTFKLTQSLIITSVRLTMVNLSMVKMRFFNLLFVRTHILTVCEVGYYEPTKWAIACLPAER